MPARLVAILLVATALISSAFGRPHSVRQLAPGVYVWQGDRDNREPANCTWVVFKNYVLVVDATFPWGSREILSRFRNVTDKPVRFVTLTHHQAFGRIASTAFEDGWLSSRYHPLQLTANRRLTQGLLIKAAYTYSKAIDMADDDGRPALQLGANDGTQRGSRRF